VVQVVASQEINIKKSESEGNKETADGTRRSEQTRVQLLLGSSLLSDGLLSSLLLRSGLRGRGLG
jgi:hypothetical protein